MIFVNNTEFNIITKVNVKISLQKDLACFIGLGFFNSTGQSSVKIIQMLRQAIRVTLLNLNKQNSLCIR